MLTVIQNDLEDEDFDAMTSKGHKIWFLHPERTPIDLRDLKKASSNVCRYNGHCVWKLIQHLALCTELAELATRSSIYDGQREYLIAQCALHDIHEIYVGDVVSGLKKLLPQYKDIEILWETRVLDYFGLDLPTGFTKGFVKEIDTRALCLEMTYLRHPGASRVIARIGASSLDEIQVFQRVCTMSYHQCWQLLMKSILNYRVANGEE